MLQLVTVTRDSDGATMFRYYRSVNTSVILPADVQQQLNAGHYTISFGEWTEPSLPSRTAALPIRALTWLIRKAARL